MSYTASATATETYSAVDVENVVRNFSADLRMIAESSATWGRDEVERYVADISIMAKKKYLNFVDVTLLNRGVEVKAARYTVNESSGELVASRPGGVLWPRIAGTILRIVIGPTSKWASEPPDSSLFKIPWGSTDVDISHAGLKAVDGRNFTSNAYGLERKDFTS
jgi:hypothetical protein